MAESARYRLEIAEHRLFKSLQKTIDMDRYVEATKEIMQGYEGQREQAIQRGMLPSKD